MGVVFYLISALALGGALAAVMLKNLVHCALALTVSFLWNAFLFLGSMRSSWDLRRFSYMLARLQSWWCLRFC